MFFVVVVGLACSFTQEGDIWPSLLFAIRPLSLVIVTAVTPHRMWTRPPRFGHRIDWTGRTPRQIQRARGAISPACMHQRAHLHFVPFRCRARASALSSLIVCRHRRCERRYALAFPSLIPTSLGRDMHTPSPTRTLHRFPCTPFLPLRPQSATTRTARQIQGSCGLHPLTPPQPPRDGWM